MQDYRLYAEGDYLEQKYWNLFIQDQFSVYENFWIKNIVPLTNRPANIHLKTDEEIRKIGKTANDICIAQLHYTTLKHLAKAFDIANKEELGLDDLTDGMIRLCGALDVAFELLERYKNPEKYDPWLENKVNEKIGGKQAREAWQKLNKYPLQNIRDYRNHLIHGRILPGMMGTGNVMYLPKIGVESKYFDWRKITNPNNIVNKDDLCSVKDILSSSWSQTIEYINNQWTMVLLQ